MGIFRFIIVITLLSLSLFGKELAFFMPDDAKAAQKALINEFNSAEISIDVAIYSFTHKKIAKALQKAAKRGVKINIITDEKGANSRNRTSFLAKYKNITSYTLKGKEAKSKKYYGKMHLKIAIIDNKTVVFGSANWSYSAFGLNYENLFISDKKDLVEKFTTYYKEILKEAKEY